MLKTAEQIAFEYLQKEASLLDPVRKVQNWLTRRALEKARNPNPLKVEREALKRELEITQAGAAAEREAARKTHQATLEAIRSGKPLPGAGDAADLTVETGKETAKGSGLLGLGLAVGGGLGGGYLLANSNSKKDQGYPPPGYM